MTATPPRTGRRGPAAGALATLLLAAMAVATLQAAPSSAAPSSAASHNGATALRSYSAFSKVLGRTTRGRAIRAYFRGDRRGAHQVVILGQMHGNENAGVHVANHIRRHFKPHRGRGMWVIPTMNPDGNARNTRQNARRVDLNRNFPTSGWTGSPSPCCWGGPRPASAPETRAMIRFLRDVKPDYIASLHQALAVVASNGRRDPAVERRLSRELRLPIRKVGIGTPKGKVSPSMTSWYNSRLGRHGTSVTIELRGHTTRHYRTRVAAPGLMRATLLWRP